MKSITALAAILAFTAPVNAKQAGVRTLSPGADALATEMAHYRAIAVACRASDGTNLSRAFLDPRLAAVPAAQKTLFSETVAQRAQPEIAALSGFDGPLKCDDALDVVEDQWPSVAEAGPAATPLCWSDVTGTNACIGTGDDDILSGLDPLLSGY